MGAKAKIEPELPEFLRKGPKTAQISLGQEKGKVLPFCRKEDDVHAYEPTVRRKIIRKF